MSLTDVSANTAVGAGKMMKYPPLYAMSTYMACYMPMSRFAAFCDDASLRDVED